MNQFATSKNPTPFREIVIRVFTPANDTNARHVSLDSAYTSAGSDASLDRMAALEGDLSAPSGRIKFDNLSIDLDFGPNLAELMRTGKVILKVGDKIGDSCERIVSTINARNVITLK